LVVQLPLLFDQFCLHVVHLRLKVVSLLLGVGFCELRGGLCVLCSAQGAGSGQKSSLGLLVLLVNVELCLGCSGQVSLGLLERVFGFLERVCGVCVGFPRSGQV